MGKFTSYSTSYSVLISCFIGDLGLLFQANSILESMREFDMLNDQISNLLRLRDEIEARLKDRQQLLRECGSADPRILLKHLFWENDNFTASDSEIQKVCAAFGWTIDELCPLTKEELELVRPFGPDPLTCSMEDLRVLVKNTTIDVTGLNSKEYRLDGLDMFMPPNSRVPQKFVERIVENPVSTPLWSLPPVNPVSDFTFICPLSTNLTSPTGTTRRGQGRWPLQAVCSRRPRL